MPMGQCPRDREPVSQHDQWLVAAVMVTMLGILALLHGLK